MSLYLLGTDTGEFGLRFALEDPESTIVLVQDATFMALNKLDHIEDLTRFAALYDDVEKRGLMGRLPETIRVIQYEELLEMIVQENVVCFP